MVVLRYVRTYCRVAEKDPYKSSSSILLQLQSHNGHRFTNNIFYHIIIVVELSKSKLNQGFESTTGLSAHLYRLVYNCKPHNGLNSGLQKHFHMCSALIRLGLECQVMCDIMGPVTGPVYQVYRMIMGIE